MLVEREVNVLDGVLRKFIYDTRIMILWYDEWLICTGKLAGKPPVLAQKLKGLKLVLNGTEKREIETDSTAM